MPDNAWKSFERRVLRRLGTERIPVTGERHGADGETPLFAYQVKHRGASQPPPKHLLAWVDGIVAARPQKIGVVVWQRAARAADGEALVVLRLRDWEALHRSQPPHQEKGSIP